MKWNSLLSASLLITLLITDPNAHAKRKRVVSQPSTKTESTTSLWDQWYTITVGGNVKYGFYHETLTKNAKGIHFQQNVAKKEEGYVNTEFLGVYAEDSNELSPTLFNFRRSYRNHEKNVDGTITRLPSGSLELVAKMRQDTESLPPLKLNLPKNIFSSVFFPLWAYRNLQDQKVNQTRSFVTFFEDGDSRFKVISGRAILMPPDDYAKSTKTRRYTIVLDDQTSTWWFNENGAPQRAQIQNILIERTTEKEAQEFLKD